MAAIGEEVSQELERIELTLVHEIARTKYACRVCEQHLVTAPGPERVIDKGLLGTGFLAHVIAERFSQHMPYHRLEQKYAGEGLVLSRSVLCASAHRCAELLAPIVEQMKRDVLAQDVIHTDDTTVTISRHRGGGRQTGRAWIDLDKQGRHVDEMTANRSRAGPEGVLKDYTGFIQADAYAGYDGLFGPGGATEVGCWAHARRYFVEAEDSEPELAAEALRRIGEVYAVDRQAQRSGLDEQGVCELRQRLAVGRKNWLFVNNLEAGERAVVLYSLVQTARALGLPVKDYVAEVLLRIGPCTDVEKLTPHGWKQPLS